MSDATLPPTATTDPAPPARWDAAPEHGTRWARRFIVAVVTLVLVGGGYAVYWWAAVQTYHYHFVVETVLYRCGNRGMREFAHAVQQSGAKTVISFVSDQEVNDPAKPQFKAEAAYCRAHNIALVRLPVPLGGWPTQDQILKFFSVVAEPANRPVLMHCAQGVRRTGMFMAAYQLTQLDRTVQMTKDRILPFGHPQRDLDDIRTFIDHYDPATAAVPTTMPTARTED